MSYYQKARSLRVAALITTLLFSMNAFCWANVSWTNQPRELLEPILLIPPDLGDIQKIVPQVTSFSPHDPLVIHIQDAHANFAAQKNICSLIEYFRKDQDIDLVFVEGAVSQLDRKYLEFHQDPAVNQKVTEKLAQMGELSGADLYLLKKQSPPVEFVGLENPELYSRNLELFREVMNREEEAHRLIDIEKTRLDCDASRLKNKELLELIRLWVHLENERADIKQIVRYLDRLSKKYLHRDFRAAREQKEFPNWARFLRLMDEENQLDLEKARKEGRTIQALSPSVDVSEILGEKTPSKNPRFLLEDLYADLAPQGFQFDHYPHFTQWARNRVYQYELKSVGLFQEMQSVILLLSRSLAKSEEEKALVREARNFILFSKLITLQLTREEWHEITALGVEFDRYLAKKHSALSQPSLAFYRASIDREGAFSKRIRDVMQSRRKSRALVITGGFHSEGLSQEFQSRGIFHLIVSPKLAGDFGDCRRIYKNSLLGKYQENLGTSHLSGVEKAIPTEEQRALNLQLGPFLKFVQGITQAASLGETASAKSLGRSQPKTDSTVLLNIKEAIVATTKYFEQGGPHRPRSTTTRRAVYITTLAGEIKDHKFFPEGNEVAAIDWSILRDLHGNNLPPVVIGLRYLNIPPPPMVFSFIERKASGKRGRRINVTDEVLANLIDVYFGTRLFTEGYDAKRTIMTGFEMDSELLEVIAQSMRNRSVHLREHLRSIALDKLAKHFSHIDFKSNWKNLLHVSDHPYLVVRYTSYYGSLYEFNVFTQALKRFRVYEPTDANERQPQHVLLLTRFPKDLQEAYRHTIKQDPEFNLLDLQSGEQVLRGDNARVTIINVPSEEREIPSRLFKELTLASDTVVAAGHLGINEVLALAGIEDERIGPHVTLWHPQALELGQRFGQLIQSIPVPDQESRDHLSDLSKKFEEYFAMRTVDSTALEETRRQYHINLLASLFFNRDARLGYRRGMKLVASIPNFRLGSPRTLNGWNTVTEIIVSLNERRNVKGILGHQGSWLGRGGRDSYAYYTYPIFPDPKKRNVEVYVSFWARSGRGDIERFLHVIYALNKRRVTPYVILDDPDPEKLDQSLEMLIRRLKALDRSNLPRLRFLARQVLENGQVGLVTLNLKTEFKDLIAANGDKDEASAQSLGSHLRRLGHNPKGWQATNTQAMNRMLLPEDFLTLPQAIIKDAIGERTVLAREQPKAALTVDQISQRLGWPVSRRADVKAAVVVTEEILKEKGVHLVESLQPGDRIVALIRPEEHASWLMPLRRRAQERGIEFRPPVRGGEAAAKSLGMELRGNFRFFAIELAAGNAMRLPGLKSPMPRFRWDSNALSDKALRRIHVDQKTLFELLRRFALLDNANVRRLHLNQEGLKASGENILIGKEWLEFIAALTANARRGEAFQQAA